MIDKSDFINSCVENVFKNNCIKYLKCRNDWHLNSSESIVNISGNEIKIISANQSQDEMRLNFVLSLLNATLKNYNLKLNCNIILSLSDAVGENERYTRFTFSSSLDTNHILIPDPHIFRYVNKIENFLKNETPFEKKKNAISFFGSDTGAIEKDLLNQRLKFCLKATDNPNIVSKITNFVNFSEEMLKHLGVDKSKIESSFKDILEQLEYKYILDIDGNAASWDRTPWAMASDSYLIHLKSTYCVNNNWYHSYLLKERILPIYSEEDLLNFNIKYSEETKSKQKNFAKLILSQDTHLEYMKNVLIKYNEIYNG